MTEVLHANIFFVIASVAVVLFSIIVCVILYHVLKIVKAIRRMVDRIEAGSEMIAEDVEQFRSFVMRGSLVSQLINFFMGGRRSRRHARDIDED
jgi:hypothetical protein